MEKGLLEKTGKPLHHWITVVKKSNIEKHKAIIDYLKSEHGFTYGYANFVSLKARKTDAGSMNDTLLISEQYKGKEALMPIYKKLLSVVNKFGADVIITPKKATISLIRKKQFALIKPATKTRIDLGLKLKGKDTTQRLENSGSFGTMCTHRVRLESVKEINAELSEWLKEAYDAAE